MVRRALLVLLTLVAVAATAAPEFNPVRAPAPGQAPVERLIIKLRATDAARVEAQAVVAPSQAASATATAQALEALGARAGILLAHSHSITNAIHVARLFRGQDGAELAATLARLNSDAAVEYAAPDRRKQAHAAGPNDPIYTYPSTIAGASGTETGQWYLQAPQAVGTNGTTTAAINAAGAWSITTGSTGVVIADLDTGVRFDHPDLVRATLGGKLLPGYDFVGCDGGAGNNCSSSSTYLTANDGDGWDPDPSDPGDWIDAADLKQQLFSTCGPASGSSWHGTRTAGLLGALTNNGVGIAGLAWNAWVLPVRVLGKCGGYDSDIIAGMLWAAGVSVAGVPANPYPAKVLNMSLGSANACVASYSDAISQVTKRGAVVVVSAGNEGGPVDEPANCPGAIGVAGVRHVGSKVGYSSLGPEASLAAPAGNCVNTTAGSPCLFSIDTTTNLGTTVPGANSYTDQQNANVGTSFSAPMVSGISALMLSVNGNLSPSQLLARLKTRGTRPFPVLPTDGSGNPMPQCMVPTGFSDTSQAIECNCTPGTCGAGLADASLAVNDALRPIAAIAATGTVATGQPVTLDATASAAACGHTVASYAWSLVGSPAGESLTSLTGPTTALNAAPASGTVSVQLVITDDQGRQDSATIVVAQNTVSGALANAGTTACLAAVTPPAPTVTISVAPSPITVGQSATLTWSTTNAMSCAASGSWSGTQQTSGTQSVTATTAAALTYTLTCTGGGGSANGAATLDVNAIAPPPAAHGGGGSLDVATLGLGALLAGAARRRRAGAPKPTV